MTRYDPARFAAAAQRDRADRIRRGEQQTVPITVHTLALLLDGHEAGIACLVAELGVVIEVLAGQAECYADHTYHRLVTAGVNPDTARTLSQHAREAAG